MTRPPDPPDLLPGLLVGSSLALAVLAGASLAGAVFIPGTHWRDWALAVVAVPVIALGLLGAREARHRRLP